MAARPVATSRRARSTYGEARPRAGPPRDGPMSQGDATMEVWSQFNGGVVSNRSEMDSNSDLDEWLLLLRNGGRSGSL